ncbi:MAG: hypothetical protein AAF677_17565 [Pseudomonadota bacterium]
MKEGDSFHVYQDRGGQWRWRRRDAAGKLVGAACEGFSSRQAAEDNMRRGVVPLDRWEFYKDKRGRIRWRRMAPNGKVIGAATEGFIDRTTAAANAARQGFREKS